MAPHILFGYAGPHSTGSGATPPPARFSYSQPIPPDPPFVARHLTIGPPVGWTVIGDPVAVATDFDLVAAPDIHAVPEGYLLHYPAPHFVNSQYPQTTTGNTVRLINCNGMSIAFSSVDGPIGAQEFDPAFTNGTAGILSARTVGWNGGLASPYGYDQDHLLIIESNDVTLDAEFVFAQGEPAVRVAIHVGTRFDLAPPSGGGGGES